MAERLEDEMVASYAVAITGVERTKAELAKLTSAIELLRKTEYMPGMSVSEARFGTSSSSKIVGGRSDIFAARVDQLEGRVQTRVSKAMASAVAKGKAVQAIALRAATTPTGESGRPKGRKGAGREVTGTLIKAIATNVETQKTKAVTTIVGWHGWPKSDRPDYFGYQEQGTDGRKRGDAALERERMAGSTKRTVKPRRKASKGGIGIEGANSLGTSLPTVREYLKKELGDL